MANNLDFRVKNGLVVASTATIESTVQAFSTVSGALIVAGGAGIGQDLWVGGVIHGTFGGAISTATNLSLGTAGQLVYQSAPGVSAYYGPGTAGQVLTSNGTSGPLYVSTASIQVGYSTTATNISVTNDLSSSATQFLAFVSTSSGNTTIKVAAGNGLIYVPLTGYFGIGTSTATSKLTVAGTVSISGVTTITNVTSATSAGTGALQVAGGVGVGGNLYVGGVLTINSLTVNTSATISGALTVTGLITGSISGSAGSVMGGASWLKQSDGTTWQTGSSIIGTTGGRSLDLAPNTYSNGIFSEFKNAALYATSGNYAGLITYANNTGTTASGFDPSYQLVFSPQSANSTLPPRLQLRSGIDATWGKWSDILHSGNFAATTGGWTPNYSGGVRGLANGSFKKDSGNNSTWDGQVYSSESYVTNVFCAARPSGTGDHVMWGLNSDPTTDASDASLDYAFYFANGTIQIHESNSLISSHGSYTVNDYFVIAYDGANVKYYVNGVLVRKVARATGSALYFDSSFWEAGALGATLQSVAFGSLSNSPYSNTSINFTPTAILTSNYTASANELVRVNSYGGTFTVTLPATPVDGDRIAIFDVVNRCGVTPILVAANTKTIEGDATGLSIDLSGAYVVLLYNSTALNWKAEVIPPPSNVVSGIANGGTGASTLALNAVLLGNNVSALQTVSPGTTGNVLTSNGITWVSSATTSAVPLAKIVSLSMVFGS